MSLKIIVPDPSINTPVPLLVPSPATEITLDQIYRLAFFAVPSPVTEIIFVHNIVVPFAGNPVDGIGVNLLLFDLSKYCPGVARNFINAPGSIYVKSVDVNCPTFNV